MNTALAPELNIGHRYQRLDLLGRGGMGVVYKVHDRLTGEIVALKQVSVPAGDLQFSRNTSASDTALSLALEFRALASLRHPHIVAVLDYGFQDQNIPFYTMQYLEKAVPITDYSRTLKTPQKIQLLIQLLSALMYLHRHHILHRDLKPQNIFVTADQTVKVMDFGLAVDHRHIDQTSSMVGTFAYMAPELFAGESASIQSDLYAVGIIAYEMLVGQHPFNIVDPASLLTDLFLKMPDLSMFDARMAVFMEKLLAKVPPDRYPNASAAAAALCEAADMPPVPEDATVRESFLQASSFVGRETEMKLLTNALENVLNGYGGAYLIGGESGVGKSRLIDELRIRALMQGAVVLRGQEVAENGLPYQLWREPLRRLCLNAALTPLDASVLKDVIPDIGTLLAQDVADAAPLSGNAYQQRLNHVIVSVFRQQKKPLVLLLEDLHWSSDSLNLLNMLLPLAADVPWLVVGNYRDDEAPALRTQLNLMQHVKLERLSEAAVAELSEAMLGSMGHDPQVLDLIQRESEGNTFFIVEVVRTLAEDAGRLEDVGLRTLPAKVFSGGIQKIVARRLSRIPDNMQEWIKWAAVQGRELDLRICQVLAAEDPDENKPSVENWLTACLGAAVFDVQDERWRFAHDKIREAILNDLSDEERRTLHRRVAQAIEQIYPQDGDRAANLYEHWSLAGDVMKQGACAVTLVNQYIRRSHYQAILALFEQVYPLVADRDDDESLGIKMHLWLNVGIANDRLNNTDQAELCFRSSLDLAVRLKDTAGEAKTLSALSMVEADRGHYQQARELIQQAYDLAESMNNIADLGGILTNKGILAYLQGDFAQAQADWEEGIRRLEGTNERYREAGLMINLGSVAQVQGRLEDARRYWELSGTIMKELGDRNGYSMSLQGLGNIARDQGDFKAALACYDEGIVVYREIGNRQGQADMLHAIGDIFFYQEDLQKAQTCYEQSLVLRRKIGSQYAIGNSLISLGEVALNRADYAEARRLYEDAKTIFESLGEQSRVFAALNGLAGVQLALQPDDPTIGTTFRQSLREAVERGENHFVISSMLGLVEYLLRTDPVLAVETAAWIVSSPNASAYDKTILVDKLRPRLEASLSAEAFQAAWQRGQTQTEEQILQRLLA